MSLLRLCKVGSLYLWLNKATSQKWQGKIYSIWLQSSLKILKGQKGRYFVSLTERYPVARHNFFTLGRRAFFIAWLSTKWAQEGMTLRHNSWICCVSHSSARYSSGRTSLRTSSGGVLPSRSSIFCISCSIICVCNNILLLHKRRQFKSKTEKKQPAKHCSHNQIMQV